MSTKIVLVPTWLEAPINQGRLRYHHLQKASSMEGIVSPSDIIFYRLLSDYFLEQINKVTYALGKTRPFRGCDFYGNMLYENDTVNPYGYDKIKVVEALRPITDARSFVTQATSDEAHDGKYRAAFHILSEEPDVLYVGVSLTETDDEGDQYGHLFTPESVMSLVEGTLRVQNNYLPFSQVAATELFCIFERWLKSQAIA